MTIIWPGTPGESFTNETDKILYQFVCSWVNTCGTCAQYHLAVARWWGKMHRGCNCISRPVYPDKKSLPYEDWHDIVDALPPDQQVKLVGASNFKLIEAGIVDWKDVVTSTRVRLLREVVSRSKLDVNTMIKAGVDETIATKAHQSVTTPAHVLAQQHRQQLVQQMIVLGIQPQTVKGMIAGGLAQQIGLGGGFVGAPPVQTPPPGGTTRAGWIGRILGMLLRPFRQRASMGPKKGKPKP